MESYLLYGHSIEISHVTIIQALYAGVGTIVCISLRSQLQIVLPSDNIVFVDIFVGDIVACFCSCYSYRYQGVILGYSIIYG